MDKIEFAGMTDDMIDALTTDGLRELAEDRLSSWERPRVQVASFKITDAVVRTPGVLSALEALIAVLGPAYEGRGPSFTSDYEAVSLSVWDADDVLLGKLRRKRDEVAKEVAETEMIES